MSDGMSDYLKAVAGCARCGGTGKVAAFAKAGFALCELCDGTGSRAIKPKSYEIGSGEPIADAGHSREPITPVIGPLPDMFPGDRKAYPVFTGMLRYFPDACAAVANCSHVANEQHNPGEPLHWARDKSIGEGDELLRHLMQAGTLDADGIRHSAKVAWRALELLQREIEAARKS